MNDLQNIDIKEINNIMQKLQKCDNKMDFLGIICCTILSKQIFKKNSDIVFFLKQVFHKEYKKYVICSRTLIIARVTKYVYNCDENQQKQFRKQMILFFKKQKNSKPIKKNANDKFDIWLKGI
ncbi:hypothetical protein FGL68_06730 [Acinetobacter baumannii]|nr:hypothetical protein [Acinetobacter baumannii]